MYDFAKGHYDYSLLGSSLLPVAKDHFIYLPDSTRLTTPEGKVFKYQPGNVIAVGPDYFPITDEGACVRDVTNSLNLVIFRFLVPLETCEMLYK